MNKTTQKTKQNQTKQNKNKQNKNKPKPKQTKQNSNVANFLWTNMYHFKEHQKNKTK